MEELYVKDKKGRAAWDRAKSEKGRRDKRKMLPKTKYAKGMLVGKKMARQECGCAGCLERIQQEKESGDSGCESVEEDSEKERVLRRARKAVKAANDIENK